MGVEFMVKRGSFMNGKKKIIFRFVIMLIGVLLSFPECFASPVQQIGQHSIVPLKMEITNAKQHSAIMAMVDHDEVLVPVDAIIKYINTDVSFDPVEKKVYLYIPQVEFKMETTALDQRFDQGMVLNFTPYAINGVYYLNVKGLEKVLGIKIVQENQNKVVIEKENYRDKQLNVRRDTWKPVGKINLVWDVNTTAQNLSKESPIAGLDVISPTWFSIVTGDGFVASKADMKYVEEAHRKGYKVWALINNNFNPDMTHQLLLDEQAQEKVIRQLLVYSSLYNLDGLNIDFENIYDEDKERLTQFVEKITTALKQQNIVVSIDVTVPANVSFWSKCYDRAKLGHIVDYVMVMTYDEYWAKSRVSGPVASIGWVEKGIKKMLAEVPKEKLLMGLPLYSREWEELESGSTRSKTMSMPMIGDLLKSKNLDVVWLEDKGLHYVEYDKEGRLYRMWIEDEQSLALKLQLATKYNLVGAASWRKGFETSTIWGLLNAELKKK